MAGCHRCTRGSPKRGAGADVSVADEAKGASFTSALKMRHRFLVAGLHSWLALLIQDGFLLRSYLSFSLTTPATGIIFAAILHVSMGLKLFFSPTFPLG